MKTNVDGGNYLFFRRNIFLPTVVYYGIGSASSGTHAELKTETLLTEICT